MTPLEATELSDQELEDRLAVWTEAIRVRNKVLSKLREERRVLEAEKFCRKRRREKEEDARA